MAKDKAHLHSNIEHRYRSILEQSPFSIQILSPDGFTVQVNKAWEELWGAKLENIAGYNMLEDEQLVRRGVMPYIQRAFAGEATEIPPVLYDPEETIPGVTYNADPRRWTKAVIYPIKDETGAVREVVLIHEDITEQMLAQEKIKTSEERYRSLLENASDIIYSHDLNGTYLSINAAGEKITGYSADEVVGKMNISQIVCPEHLEMVKKKTAEKFRDPTPTVYEVDVIAKDGRRLTFEVSTRISHGDGLPVAVEGIARDVTERKRAQQQKERFTEQLAKQKRRLQELVSSVPGVVWEAWGEPDDAAQRINFVSEHVEEMLGYSVEEWLSTPNFWLNIVHPEDREKAVSTAAATFFSRQSGINRFRWMRKDGRAIWVEARSIAIFDDSGKPIGMRGVTMDITERRQKEVAEKFLSEASTTLASSLDYETTLAAVANLAVPDFADWCSVEISDESSGILQRLAMAHSDPEKVKWATEISARYQPDMQASYGVYQVLRTGKSEFYSDISDELLVRSARDERHLELLRQIGFSSAMLVPLKVRGNVLGVITFVHSESGKRFSHEDLMLAEDLASRAALAIDNARLFRNERETRRAAERTSDFLSRLQEVSSVLSQNLMLEEIPAAIIKQGVKSLGAYAGVIVKFSDDKKTLEIVNSEGFPPEVIERWRNFKVDAKVPISDAARTGVPVLIKSMENLREQYPQIGPLASVTGSKSLAALPLTVKEKVIGAMGFSFLEEQSFNDDERAFMVALSYQCAQAFERAGLYENERRLRLQAETANRMKDEFLATVSHELRTPLNAIVGWSSILSSQKNDAELSRRAVETIARSARAQSQIIEDLLDVSRIITGKLSLSATEIELNSIVETAVESINPTAKTKNISISANLPEETLRIRGDADRMQQILWNLLSNAVKFTPESGQVVVTLYRQGSSAQIAVRDSGQGIEAEFLPFVFDRFSQADASSSRKFGGLGLGLAIVRHLVEMHGGSVKAESEGVGRGAAMKINLPLLAVAEPKSETDSIVSSRESEPSAIADDSDLKGISLLIVEDDADSRELLVMILESAGARVEPVGSVAEALESLEVFRPDALISDIGMPGEDGYSLIRRVREKNHNGNQLPAIALTAYAREEDSRKALDAGFQVHLVKPFEQAALISAVKVLIESRSASE